jgi:methionyl-tRNA formyltransferase
LIRIYRGGSGILRGDILTLCKYGIISFHHGNNDINRGGPPGFWEVYNKEPSTGFIIQKLKNELDGGDVLFKGEIMTSSIYSIN